MRLLRRLLRERLGDREPEPIAEYHDADLADVIVRKTEALLKLERIDSLIPGDLLLPTLLGVAAADGAPLRVLDFGGAAGLHYLAAKRAFPERRFRWAVMEMPLMVNRAAHLAGEELQFFSTIETARNWLGGLELLHSIGALQYNAEPIAILEGLLALEPRHALWAKLALGCERETQFSLLCEHGPGPIPSGITDRRLAHRLCRIDERAFRAAHRGYRLAWRGTADENETSGFLFVRQS
jgi:putative methyltransferase (TIGR04325 family)